MKRTTVARFATTAALVGGVALSFVAPVGATPQDVASQSASPAVSAELLNALQRDLGLSPEAAFARHAQESAAATAEQTLTKALGSDFGGAWFDAGLGKLVVGVTDAARAQEIRAAGAEARVVDQSVAELNSIKANLDRHQNARPKSVTGWYVDLASNSVVAEVLKADAAGSQWARTMGASAVTSVAEAPKTFWNLIGGQAIYFGGGRCSIGFNARNSSGTRYIITAGHCTDIGGTVSGVGGTIGPVAGGSFPGSDYGIIRVSSSSAVSTPYVDRYSSGSDVIVAGSTQSSAGSSICRSGSTTGWRCGTIGAHNQTVCYPQGCVGGLTRTSACAEPGDSGGSFVSSPTSTGRVQAQGMTSGGSGNCSSGGTTYHQPVREPMSVYGLSLYTG